MRKDLEFVMIEQDSLFLDEIERLKAAGTRFYLVQNDVKNINIIRFF
jgi:hypothetical protein